MVYFGIAKSIEDAMFDFESMLSNSSIGNYRVQDYYVKYGADDVAYAQLSNDVSQLMANSLRDIMVLSNAGPRCVNKFDIMAPKQFDDALTIFKDYNYWQMMMKSRNSISDDVRDVIVREHEKRKRLETRGRANEKPDRIRRKVEIENKHTESEYYCEIKGVKYMSISDAAKALNLSVSTIKQRLYSNRYPQYKISPIRKRKSLKNVPVRIHGIDYPTMGDAAKALDLPIQTIHYRLHSNSKRFENYIIINSK